MSTDRDTLHAALAQRLPIRAARLQLALTAFGDDPPVTINENGNLKVSLRLVIFDAPDSDTIGDIKEQELFLGKYTDHPDDRWLAYIEATARAAPTIVEHLDIDPESIMPHDLFSYWELLADPTLHTADDFTAALRDPVRLAAMNRIRAEEDWREALAPCGLADHTEAVRALLRPALRLELERDESDDIDDDDSDDDEPDDDEPDDEPAPPRPTGESRIGGDPDLPPDLPWPEVAGQRLMFVAQFDLAALARHPAARELPDHGLLSFFYEPHSDDDSLASPVRVLHFTDRGALVRRRPPPRVERIAAHTLTVRGERHLPAVESEFFYHSLLPVERVLPWYARLAAGNGADPPISEYALGCLVQDRSERDFERPCHHLLGHPSSIQGDPYLDVEMTTHPGRWNSWKDGTPEAHAIRTRALRWRLLLQIDAYQDDELLLNQDGGFFYFWIPADALATHDWTRARGSLQCH